MLYTGDIGAQGGGDTYTSFRDTPQTLTSGGTFSLDAAGSSTSNVSLQNNDTTIGYTDPSGEIGQPTDAGTSCGTFGCGVYDINLPAQTTSSITIGLSYAGTGTPTDWFSQMLGVTPAPTSLDCTTSVYAIGTNTVSALPIASLGSSSKVTASSAFTIPSDVTGANALGIGPDGAVAYFIGTQDGTLKIFTYTADTGEISSTAAPSVSSYVAGAVDPLNGLYYFGSVLAGGSLYAYNPTTGTTVRVATIPAAAPSTGGNGDIAFSATGDLFIVSQNRLVSVPAADVPTTAGTTQLPGTLISTGTFAVSNGIAFDRQGYVYVEGKGTGVSVVQKVNPVTGQVVGQSTTSSLLSTDLATCATPPTLSLQKNVTGRANTGDQFTLSIAAGTSATTISTTTTGSDTGIQSAFAGPTVGLPGTVYKLSETGSGTTDLALYSSTYSCVDTANGDAAITSGTGTSFDLTYPAADGQAIMCTFTNTPLVASYTVAKAASVTSAIPGDKVTYSVSVVNTGRLAYTAADPASFSDDLSAVLDDATYDNDASAGASVSGSTLRWSGALAVGATVTVTYSVTVDDPDSGDHVLTNAAVPTGTGGSCAAAGDCATSTPVRSIHVTKTTTATDVTPGERVPYTITVTNTGKVAYTDANPASITDDLTDVLDDATYDGDLASSTGAGASYAAPVVSWSGALGIGGTVTVTYSVTVNTPDTGDLHLRNAVVTPTGEGGNCPTSSTDPSCDANVPAASFTVAKTSSATTAHLGQKVTYTVTVKNTGAVAYTQADPASFSDDLSRVLDDATYDGDASNGATVDGTTLSWSGALAVGATETIVYSVTVNDPDQGDHTLMNTVAPTSPGGSCATDGICSTSTPVAAYTVAKTADTMTAQSGQKVTYTITVTNTGAVAYTAASPASFSDDLSKVLDDATYNGDASSGATVSGKTLTWSGELPVGETSQVTYSVTVNAPDAGDHQLDNTVTPTSPGGACAASDACATSTPVLAYAVHKTASSSTAVPGQKITYTIAVTNTGNAAYTRSDPASFTDDLTNPLKLASYNDDADHGATYSRPILAWSGALGVGKTVSVTYSMTVKASTAGKITNVVVTPPGVGANCSVGAADPDCTAITRVVPPTGGALVNTGGAVFAGTGVPAWVWVVVALIGLAAAGILIRRRRNQGQI